MPSRRSSRSRSRDSSHHHKPKLSPAATSHFATAGIIQAAQAVLEPNSDHDRNERTPLLNENEHHHRFPLLHRHHTPPPAPKPVDTRTRVLVWSSLTILTLFSLLLFLVFPRVLPPSWSDRLPRNPTRAALYILEKAPVIDGHIDLPILLRSRYANNVSAFDMNGRMPAHVDIPRLRQGKVGGFFWSVYVDCADPIAEGPDFLTSTWRVRDTLEQIDVARLTIDTYPDVFELTRTSSEIRIAILNGKIASLLGVEGAHQLGNSIAVLRQYHALGVRYVTLTHTCHNAFADSAGLLPGKEPLHDGLSPLGFKLIDEMNRLGVLVDLSHTSDDTAIQALNYSKAPVIWSHSSARSVHWHVRNVPDDILRRVGFGKHQKDGVIMVNFAPFFVAAPGNATLESVADHIDHIGKIAGRKHVGLGSDFDGIGEVPRGLEDVSKYVPLIAEMIKRGWSKGEIAGLTGANLLRVMEGAEKVALSLQKSGARPIFDLYDKRQDLPEKPALG